MSPFYVVRRGRTAIVRVGKLRITRSPAAAPVDIRWGSYYPRFAGDRQRVVQILTCAYPARHYPWLVKVSRWQLEVAVAGHGWVIAARTFRLT